MNVFCFRRGEKKNHGIIFLFRKQHRNGNIEIKSYQYQSCNQYVKNLLSFFSCFLHHVSTHCMCIFIILIPLSLSLTFPPLKALRHNYEAKFIDCPMAHFMMCVLRRLFQVSQSHTRKGGK